MATVKDFWVHQSEGYDFIMDTAEHLRIAVHGTIKERSAAADRYMEACRLNYMSVSEAVALWRFSALSEEDYQEGLPAIREAEAAAAAVALAQQQEEIEKAKEAEEAADDVEGLVLERYGDLECPACGLQYSIFCFSDEETQTPCTLCNPQYIVDYKQWLEHVDNA